MAAIFLFATWGFQYGIGALWTVLFWAAGYAVLYLILPQFMEYRHSAGGLTLHSFIRKQFTSSRGLQVVTAMATMVGLLGTMLAEIDYTVAIFQPATEFKPIVIQLTFLVLGLTYVVWNGYQAEVNTERIQVPVAYIGILTVLLATFPQVYVRAGESAYWAIAVTTGALLVIMAVGKSFDIQAGTDSRLKWMDWQPVIPLAAIGALAVESVWIIATLTPGTSPSVLSMSIPLQLQAQGIVGLLSLFLANVLWMPVDMSTWQRVGSVKGDDDVAALKELRRGTFRVLLESPASWGLGVVLGWSISAGGLVPPDTPDPYSIVALFAGGLLEGNLSSVLGSWQRVLYPVFVVSCVAVMISTVTSILTAVSFTADRDLLPDNEDNLARVRVISASLVLAGFVIYEGLRSIFQANLATLLYGAYSAQLSLFFVTMFALYKKRLSSKAAFWSISLGLFSAGASTVVAIVKSAERPELAVLAPLFAVLGSLVGYVFGYQLVERKPGTVN